MRLPDEQLDVIGLMAAHEAAVADLYRAYARSFPAHRELLQSLAADEVQHARQIARFAEKVRAGLACVSPGRFSAELILTSLDHVKQRLEEAKRGGVSLVEALSTSADLENTFIEARYFEIIESDGPELKELLKTLAVDFKAHRDRLRQALERERGAAP